MRRLLATGRTDEGQALYAKAVEVWPDQPSAARERIAMLVGEADPRVALAELERLLPRLARGDRPLPLQRTELRWRTFPASRDPAALDSEAEVEFAASPETAWYIVAAMTRMGESERALAWLARAPREAPRYQWAALFWPDIAPLRRDPQFFQAMAELGFVELWRKRGKWPDFCSEPELRYDCQTEAARLVASSRS